MKLDKIKLIEVDESDIENGFKVGDEMEVCSVVCYAHKGVRAFTPSQVKVIK